MITSEFVYTGWHIFNSILVKKFSWNAFKTSNKLNKIWLRELNTHISTRLRWVRVLKIKYFNFKWNLKELKNIFNPKKNNNEMLLFSKIFGILLNYRRY